MYQSIADLVAAANNARASIAEIVIQQELENTAQPREAIHAMMAARLEVMRASAAEGMARPVRSLSGLLRGNAHRYTNWLKENRPRASGSILSAAIARALSVGEVNASMGCIVATPTAGAAGTLPAVLLSLQEAHNLGDEQVIAALFTAAGFGSVIMLRATVSGAAAGCQAETGSAAAMAAAAGVEALGGTPDQAAHAAAFALQNMLGLVCDPIGGLVEVPCVFRNAGAAAQSLVAIDMALAGLQNPIPADEVIEAMERIGSRMDERFKETAQGGVAATPTGRMLTQTFLPGKPEKTGE